MVFVTPEGDDNKRVKTRGSIRVVPVHTELVRLGFIEFVDKQRKAGSARVFPDASRNANGQIISGYSKKFGLYLQKLLMKDGRGLSLYSLRHGWVDAVRRAGYMDTDFGFMMGHSRASMTGRYGKMPQGVLSRRVEIIEAVNYPGLNLELIEGRIY